MTTNGNPTNVDTQDCTGNHCHRPRSPRQEGSRNDAGIPLACHRPSGWGTANASLMTAEGKSFACKLHGGRTPGSISSGQTERARQAVATYGGPVDVEPLQALLDEVHRSAGHVAWLGTAIANLDSDELTWGLAEENVQPDIWLEDGQRVLSQISEKYKAGAAVLIQMYMAERKQLVSVSKEAIAAGASERMVSLYENVYAEVGNEFVDLIGRVLERLDLTPAQRAEVPNAVVTELRILTEGES